MTGDEALAYLAALGPLTFLAGLAVGYFYRDQLGRTHHDHHH